MRMGIFGLMTLGVGGAALHGRGHDVERVIAKPPEIVYAAMSALAPEGVQSHAGGELGQGTLKVDKELGQSIRYELLIDGKQLGEVDLGFAPAEALGQTKLTADIDVDKALLGQIAGEQGAGVVLIPDAMINVMFAQVIEGVAQSIEQGKPLGSIYNIRSRLDDAGSSVESRRWEARRSQAERVQPQMKATPMMDPNQSAREFMGR